MSFKQLLLADLQRQYHYAGLNDTQANTWGIFKKALNPRFAPVLLWRIASHFHHLRLTPLAKIASLLNFLIFGIEIGLQCEIGGGLYIPHPVGTVIGATKIGHNATILQGVTLGAKEIDISYLPANRPTIGDNVTIGAGAKVLGGIKIGNNVTVGANAVVTKSLPDNVVAAGVPAKIIRTNEIN
jgi:serine O-acetyltransferase